MNTPTKKIKTPLAGAEIEIKDWITGGDAEYIDEALMAGVAVKPDLANKTAKLSDFDTKAINNEAHREIEKFIVSVDGVKDGVVKLVMNLPEDDYDFIKTEIANRRKKKEVVEAGQQT